MTTGPHLPLELPSFPKSRGKPRESYRGSAASAEPLQLQLFGPALRLIGTPIIYAEGEFRRVECLQNSERNCIAESIQCDLTIDLFSDCLGDLVQFDRYVRRCKMAYLDRHFPSWVARIPKLRKLSFELMHQEKHWLGDVVRMTEDELLSTTSAKPATLEVLKADLAGVGLRLGMHTWDWRPSKSPYVERFER